MTCSIRVKTPSPRRSAKPRTKHSAFWGYRSGGSISGQAILTRFPGDGGLGDAEMLGRARLGAEPGKGIAQELRLPLLTGFPQARPLGVVEGAGLRRAGDLGGEI